jgi:LysM repeat protein
MKVERSLIVIALCFLFLAPVGAQELLNYPLDTINGEEVYRYQVERGIGLYRIGVNFNVAQSEIIRLNPQLRDRGLHYAEVLLIPTGRNVQVEGHVVEEPVVPIEPVVEEPVVEENPIPSDTIRIHPIESDSVVADSVLTDTVVAQDTRRVVELALMLPFESQQTKRSGNAERMMEFYQGALLALHDLQNDSTLYRLRVYDTERSERKVQALCDSTELDSVKAILGLVYPIQIERMAAWCETHHVPLLLPFSDEVDLASHPHVLQFNSTDEQEADSLCAWLKAQGENIHVVVTEVREAEIASSIRTLRKRLKAHGISYTGLPLRDLMNDSAAYAMDLDKENIILLHSDRYQQVRVVLPHIAALRKVGHNVRLISQYAWQKEHIDLPQVYTSVFTAETSRDAYDALWDQFYAGGHVSESPRYDLLGYDLMQALIGWLQGEQETTGIQSVIHWKQVQQGGFQNACVKVLAY